MNTNHAEATVEKRSLEETAEKIDSRLESIDKSLKKLSGLDKEEKKKADKEENKATSKTAVSLTFAAIGFKLGGVIGAKIGALYGVATKDKEEDNLEVDADDSKETARESSNPMGMMSMDSRWIRQMTLWGGIGGVIGAVFGGVLGWVRGDRIEEPGDLLKKPIESLGKILGAKPKDKENEKEAKVEALHKSRAAHSNAEHSDEKNWQETLQTSDAKESNVSRLR